MAIAVACLLTSACGGDKKKDGEESKGKSGASEGAGEAAKPNFDKAAAKAALQGTWLVGRADNPTHKYVINGDDAEVTMYRMLDDGKPTVVKGALRVDGPHKFAILKTEFGDETAYGFSFLELGDVMHIGNGVVLPVANLDAFTFESQMFEKVEFGPSGCKWTKTFGDEVESRDATCAFSEADGKKWFTYQERDPFDEAKMVDRKLLVVDGLFVGEQLIGEVATKQ